MEHLPKSLTKVTTFSKLLALFIFAALGLSIFYLGILYDQMYVVHAKPSASPISEQVYCSVDSDCVLASEDAPKTCCPNTRCLDFAANTTIAVNGKWLNNQKASACTGHYMCPMILTVCTRQITEGNAHYNARCVSHICTKVRN